MAIVKGMYLRGSQWWLRYTPAKGQPQVRVPLGTGIEQVATMQALQVLNRGPLDTKGEFLEVLEEYFADLAPKNLITPQAIKQRRWLLTSFAEQFGVTSLTSLTVKKVERWVEWLKGGKGGEGMAKRETPIKESTLTTYIMHLRAYCTWLVEKSRMRQNIGREYKYRKPEVVGRKRFLTVDEVTKLIETAEDDHLRFILYCGFHAGMRRLEIVEARPDWFRLGSDGRRGVVNIHRTDTFTCKDREERNVPLTREFEDFLRSYLANLPADAIYVLRPLQKPKKCRYRYEFQRIYKAHLKRHALTDVTIHDMRRSFVSNKVIEDGRLIFKLAKWTGTRVEELQTHYAHLLSDDDDIEAGLKPVKREEVA